ncbi:MAG: GNAT family N-acetyltransferase [Anaerolineae bacterium]
MAITLREINQENYRVISLLWHTLSPEQQRWVAHNAISMLDAHYFPHLIVRGIYNDDTPVGLVLWSYETDDNRWWIIRLMTAAPYQGKGYGRTALQQVIDGIRDQGADAVYISFVKGNEVAEKLYASMGFVDTGEIIEGEIVYRLALK